MYDYGNARIAARRARLLSDGDLRRLADAPSSAAFLAILGGGDDWRTIVGDVAGVARGAAVAIDAAVERHRSRRLGALPRWYPEPVRQLVEALVVPLDLERLMSVVRRRAAGVPPDLLAAAVPPGALLTAAAIGRLARAATLDGVLGEAARLGIIREEDAADLARRAAGPDATQALLEAEIVRAVDAARLARTDAPALGLAADAHATRTAILAEIEARDEAVAILADAGPGAATVAARDARLARLDALAAAGRRDPLGIGAVIGYVAAVEVQAVRVRAALAAVAAGWTRPLVELYLRHETASSERRTGAATGEPAWPASS